MTTLSKSYRLILCAALISGLALPTLAEDRQGSSLGFEEARALALASSQELRQAEITLKTALNREGIAVSELFPSLEAGLSLRASARDILDGNLSPVLSLQANAQISSTGNRWFRFKSASLAVQTRAASMAGKRLAVLAAFENAWFAALRAQDSLESSRQKEESAARALTLAEKREAMGLVPRSTLLQARSRYASARSELIQSQSSSLVAHKTLEQMIGRELDTLETRTGANRELYALLEEGKGELEEIALRLLSLASEREAGIVAARIALEEAGQAIVQDLLSWLPVSASVSFNLGNDSKSIAERTSVSLTASLPLLPLNARLKASENVRLARESNALSLGSALAELKISIWRKLLDIVSLQAQLDSTAEALAWAEENHTLVFERWSMGMDNWQTLSDAEQSLWAAKSSDIARRYELESAVSALKTLCGVEESGEIINAIKAQ